MKHAVMIMAHKNVEQLCHLVEYFTANCYVFIHIDKKYKITDADRERLMAFPQVVRVYQKFNVNWGGFSILRCEMFMMREVLKHCDAGYVHLISSQDYPVMPIDEFLTFFEQYKDKDCLQYVHLPHVNWEHNTFARFQYYYPYDWFPTRYKAWSKIPKFLRFQRKHGIRRSIPKQFDHLYGNSQWFSITRESAQLIVDYTRRHPLLYWNMWMTFAPEEMYISTVLVNLKQGKDILFTNFRYIRWKNENGNCPANLDVHHLRHIVGKECAFARKIELPLSNELVQALDKYFVYNNQQINVMHNGGWEYDGYKEYTYDAQFTSMVARICKWVGIESVLDAGCGSGIYVAMLREKRIAASGFDANPYTEELSARLLDAGQEPCVQADLLDEELEAESPFDLVVCKDVLPYIPNKDIQKAIRNLARLSGQYILLSWYANKYVSSIPITYFSESDIESMMNEAGFVVDSALNHQIKTLNTEFITYKIFTRHG